MASLNGRRAGLLLCVMTLLASVYMVVYSGRIESTDTLFMFDATGSFVQFGDFLLDLSAGERRFWDYDPPLPDWPLLPVDAEPLQIWLASGLYVLADQLPGIGLAHTVWLFNVFVTAAVGGVIVLYARQLGYSERVAVFGALLYGLFTIALPYSKTFFQEPLTTLLILLTAYFVERWRASRWRSIRDLMSLIGIFALALLARRGAAIAVPALVLIALPGLDALFRPRWARIAFFAAVILGFIVLYIPTREVSADNLVSETVSWDTAQARAAFNQAIQGYLFTIGGSIWGTSPVVLFAVPGMIWLAIQQRLRYGVVAVMLLFSYPLAYAVASGPNWFGGLSWPPRFLVPLVPFFVLCSLPLFEWLLKRPVSRRRVLTWSGVIPLMAYSLWIQIVAVSLWWGEYTPLLPPQARGYTEWFGGLTQPQYLRWVLIPQAWSRLPLDFAWVRMGVPLWPFLFGLLALISGFLLLFPRWRRFAWLLPLAYLLATAWGLRAIHTDDYYWAFDAGLWRMLPVIESEMDSDDVLVIADLNYERFFLNYGKIDGPRVISLPEHPGEQPSPDQSPERVSTHPTDLLRRPSAQLLDLLASQRDTLWILADSGPFWTWMKRPVEQYMTAHYFPLREMDVSEGDGLIVRLIEYSTVAKQSPYRLQGPDYPAGLQFGESITLAGFDLPAGEVYAPGVALPVALQWQTDTPLDTPYTVVLLLAASETGPVVASAQDSQPVSGFFPTTAWRPGEPVWDNRALRLPTESGEYFLWVALYSLDDAVQPVRLPVRGGDTVDGGEVGVIPITIQVTP